MDLSIPQIALMSRLLDEALPLDAVGRRRWLEALPAEYQGLAPALRAALLPADSAAGAAKGTLTLPKLKSDGEAREPGANALQAGARVGPYELIRPLGAGGMAEVWLARRADGAFKREVALKLPRSTLHRKDAEHRFPHERDILASLEHPLIARFYDAGIDPNGLSYVAMEYVHGQPLTSWCDTHQLGIDARLELFIQVLEAVQYAHEKQILHRDLKPSNIFVTESGQVRLLDFGVAKFLESEEADAPQLTNIYGAALTPDYASPELLRRDPVDARSDIYSLGVVLFELLSGARPYRLQSGRSIGQLARALDSVDVKRPSTQIDQAAIGGRATTLNRLTRQVRGDLDAIALKALAREPAERYASAIALADDLRRYLAGKPIQALPGRLTYRLKKTVLRHKAVIAIAGTAVIAMLATVGYTFYRATAPSSTAANALLAPVQSGIANAPATTAGASEESIAVLPFVDMSEGHDQEYFSDGLAEELINHLSRSPGLKVIARTSSFQFKGRNEDIRIIAAKLGVAHLLEGSVRKAGDALRVTTQLIRASDGADLWSQTYDGSLADIFKVQDEISNRVAKALNATLALPDQSVGQESDVEAYNLVLEGNYYRARRTQSDIEKALQLYKQAIELRPNYALPWARLASAYLALEEATGTPSADYNTEILSALNRAIQLDPNLVWSYYTRAGFEIAIQWDWAAAQADHERMRALDPGSYLLPLALGDTAMLAGHAAEAVEQYQRALELNPLDPVGLRSLGEALCASDRLQECLQYRLKLQQLHPELRGINAFVAEARLWLAQLPEAFAAVQQEPEEDIRLAGLAAIYAAMGKRPESDAALKTLEEHYAGEDSYEIAQMHAYRGEADAAFDWLQRSLQMHSSKILFIKVDPFLRTLRGDLRFRTLLKSLRLPE
jgi:serine/threonine protein kinase/predicted Zn-dependent protease